VLTLAVPAFNEVARFLFQSVILRAQGRRR
jgi:hypothetical protein